MPPVCPRKKEYRKYTVEKDKKEIKKVWKMPYRPKTPCCHPGCAALVPCGQKYCEKHKALHPEEVRSAAKRGYGRKWQKASREFLRVHPLCAECMKKQPPQYVKAAVVDHRIPHRGDPKLFWDQGNWQSLCKQCHDRKTMTEDRYQEYQY